MSELDSDKWAPVTDEDAEIIRLRFNMARWHGYGIAHPHIECRLLDALDKARLATTDEPGLDVERLAYAYNNEVVMHSEGNPVSMRTWHRVALHYARYPAPARWTDEHGSPEGADRAIREAMDIP